MAGGANAVNMYLDRDIDDRMARTRLRPIPSGRMRADAVLAFGVAAARRRRRCCSRTSPTCSPRRSRSAASTSTCSSTRAGSSARTPQNIVIGGAAGAFPPLVGWAAVTGRIDLTAVYLFLIIFYWTPPHFWALALLKQRDYGTRRRADGAARLGRARDDAPDALVHADPRRRSRCCRWRSARSACSYLVMARAARRRGCCVGVVRVMRADGVRRSRRGRCTSSRCCISRCCSWRWSSIGRWRDAAPTRARGRRGCDAGRAARAARRRRRARRRRCCSIGTPGDDGVVHVRVWTAYDWSAPPRVARRARDVAAAVARGAERGAGAR